MGPVRLIPVILLKNGLIVRSQLFNIHQIIGNPIHTIQRLSNWNVDELVLLDISDDDYHDMRRDDLHVTYGSTNTLGVLKQISEVCFMPLAFGGRIQSVNDIKERLELGADKCIINSFAFKTPDLIEEASKKFGSQCIVVSIDAQRLPDGKLQVFIDRGREPINYSPAEWASKVQKLGAGEIIINSIDRDGMGQGYDVDLIKEVSEAVSVPVVACGGVGNYEHFPEGIIKGGADAVAAANIFHFFELSYPFAKKVCIEKKLNMRPVKVSSSWCPREPVYDILFERSRINKRMERAKSGTGPEPIIESRHSVKWCVNCTYPSLSATPMEYDRNGVCMGCRMSDAKQSIPQKEWKRRAKLLKSLIKKSKITRDNYDCVIAVSGGKDSYFQTHFIKNVLGLNPLLITYYGNNFSEFGERNLHRMKEVFGVDHIIVYPSVETLKSLNRLGFTVMGDMNWHNHVGAASTPMRMAVEKEIPIVIWGEHGYADLCGQYSMNDFVEWTYRNRLEHYARGYEWNYFLGLEGLTSSDLTNWKYPSDEEMFQVGLRGIHLGNYVYWEANEHTKLVIDNYGFEIASEPFDRTYRMMSNLDDIHENGVHDYMKWVKFGYGRCTDHASKDVRAQQLSRGQALGLIEKYDHVKPSDLSRWLEYTGMSETEFDKIADTFRDPRVWRKARGEWVKDNVWDNPHLFKN